MQLFLELNIYVFLIFYFLWAIKIIKSIVLFTRKNELNATSRKFAFLLPGFKITNFRTVIHSLFYNYRFLSIKLINSKKIPHRIITRL